MHFLGNESIEEVRRVIDGGMVVYLSKDAVANFIKRYYSGSLDSESLVAVANELEREPVVYIDDKSRGIASALHELASPEINGEITKERVVEIMALLYQNGQ